MFVKNPIVINSHVRETERQKFKPGGLDLSWRDLDLDLDLDAKKVSVLTIEKILINISTKINLDQKISILKISTEIK